MSTITHCYPVSRKDYALSKGLGILQLVLIAAIAVACVPKKSEAFYDSTCLPPCWLGIIPGTTTTTQAMGILSNQEDVVPNSLKLFDTPSDHRILWQFKKMTGDSGGQIHLENGIVSGITIFHEKNILNLKAVIDRFGEPINYLALIHTTEKFYLTIHFIYPERGIAFLARIEDVRQGDSVEIETTLPIEATFFFVPDRYRYEFTEGSIYRISPEMFDQALKLWKGLGEIQYIEDK